MFAPVPFVSVSSTQTFPNAHSRVAADEVPKRPLYERKTASRAAPITPTR
jgi:hypothetical protein